MPSTRPTDSVLSSAATLAGWPGPVVVGHEDEQRHDEQRRREKQEAGHGHSRKLTWTWS